MQHEKHDAEPQHWEKRARSGWGRVEVLRMRLA